MKEKLAKLLDHTLIEIFKEKNLDLKLKFPIYLETPREENFGDYSSNIAMLLAKDLNMSPRSLAESIISKIKTNDFLKKAEVAGPGFINFTLHNKAFFDVVLQIKKQDKAFGCSDALKEKILLEFVSANPTGPLHIGHGRWAVIGDCLANLLKAAGAHVDKEYYINDVGNQIDLLVESVKAVADGKPVPEGGYGGAYIKIISDKLKDSINKKDFKKLLIDHILKEQKQILNRLGVDFDKWFHESDLHKQNKIKNALADIKRKNHSFEEKGAVWFKSQALGDDKNRVLIRENGETTYFAADIAYHIDKFKRGYNRLINVWGTDHHGYVPRLLAALKALNFPSEKLEIIIGQLVSLFRDKELVRMSKRTGEIITLEEVMDEIGKDATRFFLVMLSPNTHLEFDLELAKQRSNDNPVYYVQYAHARICSILREAESRGFKINAIGKKTDLSRLSTIEEKKLMKKLDSLPDEIIAAATAREPHRLTLYARELSAIFHNFYHQHRVLSDDKEVSKSRLLLVDCTRIALRNVLKLLGISAPERM